MVGARGAPPDWRSASALGLGTQRAPQQMQKTSALGKRAGACAPLPDTRGCGPHAMHARERGEASPTGPLNSRPRGDTGVPRRRSRSMLEVFGAWHIPS